MLTVDIEQNKETIKNLLKDGKSQEVCDLLLEALVCAKNTNDDNLSVNAMNSFSAIAATENLQLLKKCLVVTSLLAAAADKQSNLSSFKMSLRKRHVDLQEKIRKMVFSLSEYSQAISEFGSKDLAKIISDIPQKNKLFSSYSKTHVIERYEGVMQMINHSAMSHAKKDEFLEDLVRSALESKNIMLLQAVFTQVPSIYKSINNEINEDAQAVKLSRMMFDMINKINASEIYQDKPNVAVNLMADMVAGKGDNLSDKSGRLYLLSKQAKNVFVISESELSDFFKYLASIPGPNDVKFVINGSHWLSGEANIDRDGHLKLLIVDPLGWTENKESLSLICESILDKAIASFDKATTYVAEEKKQNDKNVCSYMALDDVMHFESANKYLDQKIYANGLFDFLAENTKKIVTYNGKEVNVAGMPLHLLRTAQTTSLFALMGQNRKGEEILNKETQNKKAMTPAEFITEKPHYIPNADGKLQNKRLADKVEKMILHCFDVVISNPPEKIEKMMSQFTLAELQQKSLARKAEPTAEVKRYEVQMTRNNGV